MDDARARHDRFATVTFRVRFASTLHLVDDQPEAALEDCAAAATWSPQGVHMQHLAAFHARAETLLYLGRPQAALAHACSAIARMRHAPLLLAKAPRAKAYAQLAACKLAYAASRREAERGRWLKSANGDLRKVRAASLHYTDLLADALEHHILWF